jgi:hypothetical protein
MNRLRDALYGNDWRLAPRRRGLAGTSPRS